MKPDDAAARPFFGAPEPLPPYTYIPGRHPHPINDPDGHSYDQEDDLDPTMPLNASHPLFRRGVDLFNHGYYWEAHEAWESLWIMAGRCGMLADLLKALIKLAAAGVKCLERRPLGTQRHAARAAELLCNLPPGPTLGLDLNEFQGQVRWTRKHAAELTPSEGREVKPIFPFVLTIHDDCSAA